MNESEQRGILSICILAALADGAQGEAERTQILQRSRQINVSQLLPLFTQS